MGWLKKIPCCPRKLIKSGKKWVNPDADKWGAPRSVSMVKKYHPGAAACMRSKTKGKKCVPGQQCCYDCKGNLIKSGLGAGTPERVYPEPKKCAVKPYFADVKMFNYCKKHLGDDWVKDEYLKVRPPSKDCSK